MRQGFKQLLTGSLVGRALSFVLNIWISRYLGPSPLGFFTLLLTAIQSFELFTKLGLDYSISLSITSKLKFNQGESERFITQSIQKALSLLVISVGIGLVVFGIWIGPGEHYLPVDLGERRSFIVLLVLLICLFESLGSFCWDVFISLANTRLVSYRAAITAPSKLLAFFLGFLFSGFIGGLIFWASSSLLISLILLAKLPLKFSRFPLKSSSFYGLKDLLFSGFGLYIVNATTALIYLPLWAELANNAGFNDLGFLRIGQLMVQVFALLPGALLPAYFLKLRLEPTHNSLPSKILLLTWTFSLTVFSVYCLLAQPLTTVLFGEAFTDSFVVSRILVLISIVDSLVQILHTPYLARRQTSIFIIFQLAPVIPILFFGSPIVAHFSLTGFLCLRVLTSLLPFALYYSHSIFKLKESINSVDLLLVTIAFLIVCFEPFDAIWTNLFYVVSGSYAFAKFMRVLNTPSIAT